MKIKYRVWNTLKCRFNYTSYVPFISPSGNIFDIEFNSDGCVNIKEIDDKIYIIQQYTGINDINNKEIYVGDIVKIKGYDDWDDIDGFDIIYMIDWCPIHTGFRGFTKKSKDVKYAGSGLPTPIEIIGNIFENEYLVK